MIELILEDSKDRMDGAVSHARREFGGIRTGRASSALLEDLQIQYYGSGVALKQLASFSVPEARMLVISPFDQESIGSIEKAIRESDLGLSPGTDGAIIRVAFPSLTEERRKDLIKLVRAKAEDGRISLRNTRRSARSEFDKLKKDGDAPEDAIERAEKALDEVTQRHEARIDSALAAKEQELLEH